MESPSSNFDFSNYVPSNQMGVNTQQSNSTDYLFPNSLPTGLVNLDYMAHEEPQDARVVMRDTLYAATSHLLKSVQNETSFKVAGNNEIALGALQLSQALPVTSADMRRSQDSIKNPVLDSGNNLRSSVARSMGGVARNTYGGALIEAAEENIKNQHTPTFLSTALRKSETLSLYKGNDVAHILSNWKDRAAKQLKESQDRDETLFQNLEAYLKTTASPIVEDVDTSEFAALIINSWRNDVVATFNKTYCSAFTTDIFAESSSPQAIITNRRMLVFGVSGQATPSVPAFSAETATYALVGIALNRDNSIGVRVRYLGKMKRTGKKTSYTKRSKPSIVSTMAPSKLFVDPEYVYTPQGNPQQKFNVALRKFSDQADLALAHVPGRVNPFDSGRIDLVVVSDAPSLPGVVLALPTSAPSTTNRVSGTVLFTAPNVYNRQSFSEYVSDTDAPLAGWVPNFSVGESNLVIRERVMFYPLFAESVEFHKITTGKDLDSPVVAFRGEEKVTQANPSAPILGKNIVHRLAQWAMAFGEVENPNLPTAGAALLRVDPNGKSLVLQFYAAERKDEAPIASFSTSGGNEKILDRDFRLSSNFSTLLISDPIDTIVGSLENRVSMFITLQWLYASFLEHKNLERVSKTQLKANFSKLITNDANSVLLTALVNRGENKPLESPTAVIGAPSFVPYGRMSSKLITLADSSNEADMKERLSGILPFYVVPGGYSLLSGLEFDRIKYVKKSVTDEFEKEASVDARVVEAAKKDRIKSTKETSQRSTGTSQYPDLSSEIARQRENARQDDNWDYDPDDEIDLSQKQHDFSESTNRPGSSALVPMTMEEYYKNAASIRAAAEAEEKRKSAIAAREEALRGSKFAQQLAPFYVFGDSVKTTSVQPYEARSKTTSSGTALRQKIFDYMIKINGVHAEGTNCVFSKVGSGYGIVFEYNESSKALVDKTNKVSFANRGEWIIPADGTVSFAHQQPGEVANEEMVLYYSIMNPSGTTSVKLVGPEDIVELVLTTKAMPGGKTALKRLALLFAKPF